MIHAASTNSIVQARHISQPNLVKVKSGGFHREFTESLKNSIWSYISGKILRILWLTSLAPCMAMPITFGRTARSSAFAQAGQSSLAANSGKSLLHSKLGSAGRAMRVWERPSFCTPSEIPVMLLGWQHDGRKLRQAFYARSRVGDKPAVSSPTLMNRSESSGASTARTSHTQVSVGKDDEPNPCQYEYAQ